MNICVHVKTIAACTADSVTAIILQGIPVRTCNAEWDIVVLEDLWEEYRIATLFVESGYERGLSLRSSDTSCANSDTH